MRIIDMQLNKGVSLIPAKKHINYILLCGLALTFAILDAFKLLQGIPVILSRNYLILTDLTVYTIYYFIIFAAFKILDYLTMPSKISIAEKGVNIHIGLFTFNVNYSDIILDENASSRGLEHIFKRYKADHPVLLTLKKENRRVVLVLDKSESDKLRKE